MRGWAPTSPDSHGQSGDCDCRAVATPVSRGSNVGVKVPGSGCQEAPIFAETPAEARPTRKERTDGRAWPPPMSKRGTSKCLAALDGFEFGELQFMRLELHLGSESGSNDVFQIRCSDLSTSLTSGG